MEYEWAIEPLAEASIEGARYEAQLLLALTLGVGRASVVAGTHLPLTREQRARFEGLVARRVLREPFAYLRGTQEFYGREFRVTPAVLVPRPETELLVEQALHRLDERLPTGTVLMADVGTGTGCIPITLLAERSNWRALALDLSEEALAIAHENAVRNTVSERLRFVRADLLTAVRENRLDLVVSNPPYIPRHEIPDLQPEVAIHEPNLALDGGPDGLDLYRRLVVQAMFVLRTGGWLCMEVGSGQATEVAGMMERAGYREITCHRDFAGIERVVCGSH